MRASNLPQAVLLPAMLLALALSAALQGCSGSSSSVSGSPGTLGFASSTTAVAQTAGTIVIPVSRTGGSEGVVTVAYATTNGTAVAGTDYTATSGTLSWTNGDSSAKSITIPISTATSFYGTRSFTLTLSAPTGSVVLGTSATVVQITGGLSTPVPGTLAFASSTASSAVTAGSIALTVNRTVGANGTASVSYATANGTATAGTQYTTTSGSLSWADGDTAAKTITFPLNSSASFSGTLTFTVTLSSPTGSLGTPTLGTPSTSTVSITAPAAAGTLGFASTTTAVNQSAGTVSISVTRTGGSTGAVGLSYATADGTAAAGTDYTSTSGTLSWATADSAAKTITVPISTALAFNGTKTFTVTLSTPTGSAVLGTNTTNTATITGTALPPSGCAQYNFSSWKVQLPIDQFGGAGGTNGIQYASIEKSSSQIQAGFVDAYFYADSSCNLIFTAPVNGAVTTPGSGSDHTRSELRELYTGTGHDSNSDWNSSIGGTLTATGHVISVSSHADEATIAQIHGQSLVFMLLMYRPSQKDIAVDIYATNTSGSSHTRTPILTNVNLGDTFNYSITYLANTITVVVNGNTMNFTIDSSWAGSAMYFKLGAYHAASPNYGAVPADQTQTSFSAFAVSH